MLQLHEMASSGTCYQVRLLLNQRHTPYLDNKIAVLRRESRTIHVLTLHPDGKVPLPVLPAARTRHLPIDV